MKHEQHIKRKSFLKWAMTGQRTETRVSEALNERRAAALFSRRNHQNIGKNNGPLKHSHAQPVGKPLAFVAPIKSYDGFLPRNVGRSNGGGRVPSRGKMIPAHAYADYLASAYLGH